MSSNRVLVVVVLLCCEQREEVESLRTQNDALYSQLQVANGGQVSAVDHAFS